MELRYGPPTPVPIFQWEREFETLLELYRRIAPMRVLEVGTYFGGTLYHWLQNARAYATVVSVDSYAVGIDNRDLYPQWVPRADVKVIAVKGRSADLSTLREVAKHGPYDWVFIDAGHYLDEVTTDWSNFRTMAEPGGVVAFHDILPPTSAHPEIEVSFLWQRIKEEHRTLEIVADPGAEWGGIGVVLL